MKNAIKNMKKLTLYTVIKSSSDGTIAKGNMIWLSKNGDLNSVRGPGTLSEEEWTQVKRSDFEYERCMTHYVVAEDGHEGVRKK